MELGSIVEFLENKSILVTGATGFLAKIFVEKILRIQPNVKKLFLLLRAADTKSATQRLRNEVLGKELFRVLRDKWGSNLNSFISEKVTPIPGDISCENLGVTNLNLREEIWREVDVILNLAATTKFDERYDVALGINTLGASHVLNFSKKCVKLKMLLHVSTAYVSGEREGLILESPLKMGKALNGASGLDVDKEKKLVEEGLNELNELQATEETISLTMKELGMKRALMYGWPNTYVFTKAMGEMLLGQFKENLPLVILRPTIITSTYMEPFSGWIEGIRTIDSVLAGYCKGKLTCLLADPECILDAIPGDMVVNCMIVAMVAHANQPCEKIYHVGSSLKNPLKVLDIRDFFFKYFHENPWINKDGKAVNVSKLILFTTTFVFHGYLAVRYMLPLKVLQFLNFLLCQILRGMCTDHNRKIKMLMYLVELYKPYLFFKGIFDDLNTDKLRLAATESSSKADLFYFDPKCIDWEDYFVNIHIPGVLKYVLK
ncbi:alcohol-forming fatty acyl-CoA reductase-like [Vitis riparia]|uniref:alcohol-forming fatty acyl-CoA reductase-like n=1 Tax=Vitis riparia TaxID=96939 RepID=UPI00155A9AA9|nr:alcohol-forming fatty acyl-CoA reductase-like [Vitis riparia]